jgi:integrase
MGLGSLNTVSLQEARDAARHWRQRLRDGIDPLTERRAQVAANKARLTFRQAADGYCAALAAQWRPEFIEFRRARLERWVFPVIGELPVDRIDTAQVVAVLQQVWSSKPTTARFLRSWIEAILDWATVHGKRQGDNPARWKSRLQFVLPKHERSQAHFPAMPFDEIPTFLGELRQRCKEAVAAKALEFTILTATRTNEVLGAKWKEIDLGAALWTIAKERMKKGDREHRVPLSAPALALLEEMDRRRQPVPVEHVLGHPPRTRGPRSRRYRMAPPPSADTLVFATPHGKGGALAGTAMIALMHRLGHTAVPHGFRSSFRDWVAERTNFPDWVAEMALAHVIPNRVEAAYRRGDVLDKRRQLMEHWAAHCTGSTPVGGQVVPLRGVAPLAG